MKLASFKPHSISVLMAQAGTQKLMVRKDGQTVFLGFFLRRVSDPFSICFVDEGTEVQSG